jgi:hypothetical protein
MTVALPPTAAQHAEIERLLFELEAEAPMPATRAEARELIANLRRRLRLARA